MVLYNNTYTIPANIGMSVCSMLAIRQIGMCTAYHFIAISLFLCAHCTNTSHINSTKAIAIVAHAFTTEVSILRPLYIILYIKQHLTHSKSQMDAFNVTFNIVENKQRTVHRCLKLNTLESNQLNFFLKLIKYALDFSSFWFYLKYFREIVHDYHRFGILLAFFSAKNQSEMMKINFFFLNFWLVIFIKYFWWNKSLKFFLNGYFYKKRKENDCSDNNSIERQRNWNF